LESLLRTMPGSFLDIDGTRRLADFVETSAPDLVSRTVPAVVSWFELTDVLRRLVDEEVGIGDLACILDALAQSGPGPHDTVALAERSRQALRGEITTRLTRGQSRPGLANQARQENALRAIVVADDVETTISAGIERTTAGAYLRLAPDVVDGLLVAVRQTVNALGDRAAGVPLLVHSADVRPYVRRLVSLEFPSLQVLSRGDILPDAPIEPVGVIRLHRTVSATHGAEEPSA